MTARPGRLAPNRQRRISAWTARIRLDWSRPDLFERLVQEDDMQLPEDLALDEGMEKEGEDPDENEGNEGLIVE